MKCTVTPSLGAYVLGAAEPDEHSRAERHLAGCVDCQQEFAALIPLRSMLSTLSLDEVAPLVASDNEPAGARRRQPGDAIFPERLPSRGGQTKRILISAAAALVAAVLLGGGIRYVTAGDDSFPAASATALSASDPATGVQATATLTAQSRGTHISLTLLGVPPRETCHLVIEATDGRVETSATWATSYSGVVETPVSTSVDPADISSLRVVTADQRTLVQLNRQSTTESKQGHAT